MGFQKISDLVVFELENHFSKRFLIALPHHLLAPMDNFPSLTATWAKVTARVSGLQVRFPGWFPAASCCSVASCRRLGTLTGRHPSSCSLDFPGQRSERLCSLDTPPPHLTPVQPHVFPESLSGISWWSCTDKGVGCPSICWTSEGEGCRPAALNGLSTCGWTCGDPVD